MASGQGMGKRIAAMVAVLLLACPVVPAWAADASIAQAMQRTERLFLGQEVHGDVGFLLTQAAKRRGRELPMRLLAVIEANKTRMPYSVEYGLWELRNRPIPRMSFVLPPRHAGGFDPEEAVSLMNQPRPAANLGEQGQTVMLVMSNIMACDGKQSPVEMIGRPGYEYVSTHQIFGVLIAAQRQCQSRTVLSQMLGLYVGRVRDEFESQLQAAILTDIQIERAAMLCMAARCDLVPRSFHDRVLKAQAPDGLWRLADPLVRGGLLPPEHPTALAYYLLAQSPL